MKTDSTLFSISQVPTLTLILSRWLKQGLPVGHNKQNLANKLLLIFLAKAVVKV